MDFLRLLSVSAYQQITYRCKNSMAFDGKETSIDLIGENEVAINMKSSNKHRPIIIQDDCKVCFIINLYIFLNCT
jgi:hypothetical protein